MEHNRSYTIAVLVGLMTITACKRDQDPVSPGAPPNEEELITTLRLHFHSANNLQHKQFAFVDLDGDGGSVPVITADTLSVDSTYTVQIEVLNESNDPTEDITVEIADEGDLHQFFFQPTDANVSVAYEDLDVNGQPIGLQTAWTVGTASSGSITITLRHEPEKTAPGVNTGDITNAGGATDIEVSFPVVIE